MAIEPSWRVDVEKVSNGFILSHSEVLNDDSMKIEREVFADNEDTADSEMKAFLGLIYSMMDIFGIYDYMVKYEKVEK